MNYQWLLFGFNGRINRAGFWLAMLMVIGTGLLIGLLLIVVVKILGSAGPLSMGFAPSDVLRMADPASWRSAIAMLREADLTSPSMLLPLLFRAIATPVAAWCFAASVIKRLHDRDRSGWWIVPFVVVPGLFNQFADSLEDSYAVMLLALVAFVLWLWGFVELIVLKGTAKHNRFGPDPLAKRSI